MYDLADSELTQQIDKMRLSFWITKKMAYDQRKWHKKVREYEQKKEKKLYKLAIDWPLFSNGI